MLHLPRGETLMRSTTDHGPEGRDQAAHPQPDAWVLEGIIYAPPETEASFEEIER
jgi:hypothetical protein